MTSLVGTRVELLGLKRGLACLAAALLVSAPATAQSPKVGDPPEASNMRLVGSNYLQGRSAAARRLIASPPRAALTGGKYDEEQSH
jgi:hypothetical protein